MAVQISGNDITVPRDGTFSRNVSIAGTLTYEDVTNIDSVGLVTARTGIEIGARPGVAASISVDGNMVVSGITTIGNSSGGNEKLNVWEAYEQAKANCNDYEPLVVMKKNQKKPLVVIDANYFISLVKRLDK